MSNQDEQNVLSYQAVTQFVTYLMQPDPADGEAFVRRVRGLLAEISQQPAVELVSGHPAQAFRQWLRDSPPDQVVAALQSVRRDILLSEATSSVPIVAAVVTLSLIWETGHRLDHVVVPSATQDQPELTLSLMAAQLPTILTNTLTRLGETGLDDARQNEAYLMDSARFEELMTALDVYIQNYPEFEQAKYQAIVARMRMLMQVMTEDDLRSR